MFTDIIANKKQTGNTIPGDISNNRLETTSKS